MCVLFLLILCLLIFMVVKHHITVIPSQTLENGLDSTNQSSQYDSIDINTNNK